MKYAVLFSVGDEFTMWVGVGGNCESQMISYREWGYPFQRPIPKMEAFLFSSEKSG